MKTLLFLVGLLFPLEITAQFVEGKVTDEQNEPLVGASVYWIKTNIGASTNEFGEFKLPSNRITDKRMVISFVGFTNDTLEVKNQNFVDIKLMSDAMLGEVEVVGEKEGVFISNLDDIKTVTITQTELKKAACCDLAGCFGTQASVQPQTTNVITNSKELRILGLSGVYNQVLIDGFPMIQGLSYTYGISSTPGTLIDNIYIAKGANSILQGFESISGQINVETKDPDNTDKLYLNAYMNSFLEKHINANYAFNVGKWSNLTAVHTVQPANKTDRDNDDFLDLPLLTRYMVFNKWKYGNEQEWGWHSKIGLRFLNEKRVGGQTFFNVETDQGSTEAYGQSVRMNQPEIWTKTGYRFNDKSHLVFYASAYHQDQNSYFGTVKYDAEQTNFYSNAQYEFTYGKNVLKTGASLRYLNLNESISFTNNDLARTYDGNYDRREIIPGMFVENTMRFFNDKFTWIAGVRVDHHNQFGSKLTPRTLIRYDLSPNTAIRANIGTGWRTVNLFSENINLLVSSRNIIFEEQLLPEEAINYGINFTQAFETGNITGFISADYYRTDFQNQIFPDYDSNPTQAIIKNYKGTSISNGFQIELYLNFWQRFELKTGYNYLDVYRREEGVKQLLPFNARHKVLTTLSYKPLSKKFHFDTNIHWYGEQRLPDTGTNPMAFQRPDFSDPFTVVNSQFTYNLKNTEVYIGCENIFDFRQKRPIISWQDPFSPFFDSSSVWGPTRGRELYIGVRYFLKKKA